ncbi:glycosyltransferase 61 family protein [Caulobacter sp. BK020]|uniref:glycosyltransferase family 61 protein n=1 Tax=Caulobacter sp. BK020 TaxID=2512117 RepID=UPI00104E31AB|nr:glycosyltransferase 61 family protein [Caulobacter sp. BK020]TCS17440.1 capsular polysaccharide biosynthesis protein [Caulobacter sp. BK020]
MRQAKLLRILDETGLLPATDLVAFRRAAEEGGPPARAELPEIGQRSTDAFRIGGPAADAWPFEHRPPSSRSVSLCLTRDRLHLPGFGAILSSDGMVLRASAREAMERWPDLSGLPGAKVANGVTHLAIPAHVPTFERAAVFLAWGGTFNYGHFVLDCLPSLVALDEQGLLERYPPIAPPLKAWQRDLIAMTIGRPVREVKADLVSLGAAVHATSMDHYLHGPGDLLARTRARILAAAPGPRTSGRRLYFSRRSHSMRVMVNEAALEAALRTRGFEIVRPERLRAADQIRMMREAQVVVGPTGAAMTNALFAPTGARIVEIQPRNFTSQWVWAASRCAGAEWRGYVCASPVDPRAVAWRHRVRRGFRFGYDLPLDDFLAFVDAAL